MHFRQDNISGQIDLECIQILDSLCQRKLQLQIQEQQQSNYLPAFNWRRSFIVGASFMIGAIATGAYLKSRLK